MNNETVYKLFCAAMLVMYAVFLFFTYKREQKRDADIIARFNKPWWKFWK